MISVSTKMSYQEVREISLWSGSSQGTVRKVEKKWPLCRTNGVVALVYEKSK